MIQLIILFSSLVVGYLIKKIPLTNQSLNYLLTIIVMIILLVMGYNFGFELERLVGQLTEIVLIIVVFTSAIFCSNFILSLILFRREHKLIKLDKLVNSPKTNYFSYILQSAKYISIIVIGSMVGAWLKMPLVHLEQIINLLLVMLLFVIGHQMRIGGTSLQQVLLNKLGIKLAIIIIISSLLAGLVSAVLLKLPINQSLAMSSGFGWYTLSSVLVGSLINSDYSAIAFFIDFNRELIAIILLPSLGRIFPYSMVGVCGATAMDFSLPVIKQNLGQQFVVVAIASGMIMSIVVPFLIPLFAKL